VELVDVNKFTVLIVQKPPSPFTTALERLRRISQLIVMGGLFVGNEFVIEVRMEGRKRDVRMTCLNLNSDDFRECECWIGLDCCDGCLDLDWVSFLLVLGMPPRFFYPPFGSYGSINCTSLVAEGHSEPHRFSDIHLGEGCENEPSIDSRHLVAVDFRVRASAVVWLFGQAREEEVEILSRHCSDEYPFNFSVPLKRDYCLH
jgi:hypothetical protein